MRSPNSVGNNNVGTREKASSYAVVKASCAIIHSAKVPLEKAIPGGKPMIDSVGQEVILPLITVEPVLEIPALARRAKLAEAPRKMS